MQALPSSCTRLFCSLSHTRELKESVSHRRFKLHECLTFSSAQKTKLIRNQQNLDAGGDGEHGDDGGAGAAGAPGGTGGALAEVEVVTDPTAQGPGQGPNRERITTRYLTKYERARVLGTRALQIR